jgi:hypothetical protein
MWFFREKAPGEKIRNPIQGEFFATDAIDGPAQALVRESNQNSLDASLSGQTVKVRLTLKAGAAALPASRVAQVFQEAWPHYAASGNGLREPPRQEIPCPFLLVEDYGTKGLTGDPNQADPDPDPNIKNPFFLFFRAEGLSSKSGTELGRWGVGKFVFPRSSLASTHFGVTVRHDDGRRLMLGASTLKAHRIAGSSIMYTPDGLYGEPGNSGFVRAIEDPAKIDAFCNLFGITRTSEPGLSVVVPFVDPDISFAALLQASVRDYFLPIMSGRLEVTIEAGAETVTLSSATLDTVLATQAATIGPALSAQVDLARSALRVSAENRIELDMPDATRAPRWKDVTLSPEQLVTLRSRLKSRETIAVRIPLMVRTVSQGNLPSYFDIYFRPDSKSDGRPTFIREGIIISDVRGRRAREFSSLVLIEERALATMLGDSENPAHTQWQKESSNFAGKYVAGKSVIDFVTGSVAELLGIVNRSMDDADPSLTIDYFSIEPPDEAEDTEDSTTQKPQPKQGPVNPPPEVVVAARPAKLRVSRSAGGFSIGPGPAAPAAPFLIALRCAYDVRSGNPLRKWDSADFTLGPGGLQVECEGPVSIASIKNNTVLLRVDGPEFRASIEGFDVNRDLFLRYDAREVGSAGQET